MHAAGPEGPMLPPPTEENDMTPFREAKQIRRGEYAECSTCGHTRMAHTFGQQCKVDGCSCRRFKGEC